MKTSAASLPVELKEVIGESGNRGLGYQGIRESGIKVFGFPVYQLFGYPGRDCLFGTSSSPVVDSVIGGGYEAKTEPRTPNTGASRTSSPAENSSFGFEEDILREARVLKESSGYHGRGRSPGHKFVMECLACVTDQSEVLTPQEKARRYVKAFEILEKGRFLSRVRFWNAERLNVLLDNFLGLSNKELSVRLAVTEKAVETQLGKLGWKRSEFGNFVNAKLIMINMLAKGRRHREIINFVNTVGMRTSRGRPWTLGGLEAYVSRGELPHVRGVYKNNRSGPGAKKSKYSRSSSPVISKKKLSQLRRQLLASSDPQGQIDALKSLRKAGALNILRANSLRIFGIALAHSLVQLGLETNEGILRDQLLYQAMRALGAINDVTHLEELMLSSSQPNVHLWGAQILVEMEAEQTLRNLLTTPCTGSIKMHIDMALDRQPHSQLKERLETTLSKAPPSEPKATLQQAMAAVRKFYQLSMRLVMAQLAWMKGILSAEDETYKIFRTKKLPRLADSKVRQLEVLYQRYRKLGRQRSIAYATYRCNVERITDDGFKRSLASLRQAGSNFYNTLKVHGITPESVAKLRTAQQAIVRTMTILSNVHTKEKPASSPAATKKELDEAKIVEWAEEILRKLDVLIKIFLPDVNRPEKGDPVYSFVSIQRDCIGTASQNLRNAIRRKEGEHIARAIERIRLLNSFYSMLIKPDLRQLVYQPRIKEECALKYYVRLPNRHKAYIGSKFELHDIRQLVGSGKIGSYVNRMQETQNELNNIESELKQLLSYLRASKANSASPLSSIPVCPIGVQRSNSPVDVNRDRGIGLMGYGFRALGWIELTGILMAQANFFKSYLLEGLFISKTFQRIKNFYAGKPAFGVKIRSYALTKMLGSYRALLESYVERIYRWIISNPHIISSLKIINVNSNNSNFALLFHKYGFYLLSLIFFIIPYLLVKEILFTLHPPQLSLFPGASPDSFAYFFFSAAPVMGLFFSVFAHSDWFSGVHKNILAIKPNEVNKFPDTHSSSPVVDPVLGFRLPAGQAGFSVLGGRRWAKTTGTSLQPIVRLSPSQWEDCLQPTVSSSITNPIIREDQKFSTEMIKATLNPLRSGRLGDERLVVQNILVPSLLITLHRTLVRDFGQGLIVDYNFDYQGLYRGNRLVITLGEFSREITLNTAYTIDTPKSLNIPARGLTIMALLRHEILQRGWTIKVNSIFDPRVNDFLRIFFKNWRQQAEDSVGYDSRAPESTLEKLFVNVIAKPKTDKELRRLLTGRTVSAAFFSNQNSNQRAGSAVEGIAESGERRVNRQEGLFPKRNPLNAEKAGSGVKLLVHKPEEASSPVGAVVGTNGTAYGLIQEIVVGINSKPAANSGYNWPIRNRRGPYSAQEFFLRAWLLIKYYQARAPPRRV